MGAKARLRWTLMALLSWLVCVTVLPTAPAQTLFEFGKPNVRQVWTTEHGLPQSTVKAITQTPDGYLWLATFGGLVRFDGRVFEVLDVAREPELASNRVLALAVDRGGALWIGTATGGASRRRGDRLTHFPPSSSMPVRVESIVETTDGAIWFGGSGLARWQDDRLTRVPVDDGDPDAQVAFLLPDAQQGLWIVTETGSILLHRDGVAHRVALPGMTPDDPAHVLSYDARGTLTAFTRRHTFILEGESFTRGPDLGGDGVPCDAMVDREGTCWLAADGLWARSPGEASFRGVQHEALATWIRAVFEDREGNIWAGTHGQGLVLLQRDPSAGLDFQPDQDPVGITGDDDGLWIAFADTSIMRVTTREVGDPIRPHEDPPRDSPVALGCADGVLWWTYGRHLVRRDGEQMVRFPVDLGGPVLLLEAISRQTVWVLTAHRLARFDDGLCTADHELPLPPDVGPAWTFGRGRDGAFWIASAGVLLRFDGTGFASFRVAELAGAGEPRSLYAAPDGAIWIGLYGGGLVRFRDGASRRITAANGLPDNAVSKILEGPAGLLWINSNRGVFRVSLQALNAAADGVERHVPCRTFPTGEANGGSGFRAANGVVWFPTIDRLVGIDPASVEDSDVAPGVAIEEVRAAGLRRDDAGAFVVPPEERDVVFRFTGLSFRDPGGTRFRHRLDDYDRAWIEDGHARQVSYTNLSPGRYRFRVVACNADGIWSPEGAALDLVVESRLGERPWVRATAVLVAILLAVAGHRLRVRAIERRNAQLRREIAERRRAERAFAETTEEYRALVETASDAIVTADADGRILFANPATNRIFGHDATALHGRHLSSLMPALGSQTLAEGLATHVDDRTDLVRWSGREIEGRHERSHPLALEVSMAEVTRVDSRSNFTLVVRDVSERLRADREKKDLQERLREAERLESLGRLAGGVAHDFNNILTALIGYAQILRDAIAHRLDAEEREYLTEIERCSERAATLTRQLLAFGRRQFLSPEVLDPNEVVRSVCPMLARLIREDIAVELELEENAGAVRVDRGQLEQVIMNLVLNARDAMSGGGRITIGTSSFVLDDTHAVRHPGAQPGLAVRITVRDTGSGIPEDVLPHIFEPFYTTKEVGSGTGLGLASVHGVVSQSGGHVTVDSEVGRGTTFSVFFPRANEVPPTLHRRGEPPGAVGSGECILVCDDEDVIARAIGRILRSEGYETILAAGPREALRIAETRLDEVDLLITDVVMPEIRGPELVRRLHSRRPDLRVLFISGYAPDEVARDGMGGGLPILGKPFSAVELLRRVRLLLDHATSREA